MNNRSRLQEFFQLGELVGYFFRKRDHHRALPLSLRFMHGVNKLSIIIFLAAVVYLVIKHWVE